MAWWEPNLRILTPSPVLSVPHFLPRLASWAHHPYIHRVSPLALLTFVAVLKILITFKGDPHFNFPLDSKLYGSCQHLCGHDSKISCVSLENCILVLSSGSKTEADRKGGSPRTLRSVLTCLAFHSWQLLTSWLVPHQSRLFLWQLPVLGGSSGVMLASTVTVSQYQNSWLEKETSSP